MYVVAMWDTREGHDLEDPNHSFCVRDEDNILDAIGNVLINLRKYVYLRCYDSKEYDRKFRRVS